MHHEHRQCSPSKEEERRRPRHAREQLEAIRHRRRARSHRARLRIPHQGRAAQAQQLRLAHPAERLRDHPRHRHGHGYHRHAYRFVGRLDRGLRRRCVRHIDGTAGRQLDARNPHLARRGPDHRLLAGLLGGLRGHPRLHHHTGRHAHLPWPRHRDRRRIRADHLAGVPRHRPQLPAATPRVVGSIRRLDHRGRHRVHRALRMEPAAPPRQGRQGRSHA